MPLAAERGLYAEETAQAIDAEIRRFLSEAHATARQLLTDHRDQLEAIARRLLVVEVMDGDELRRMLGVRAAEPTTPAVVPAPTPAD